MIYGQDTQRLRPGEWLNDVIMDAGLKLIEAWHWKRLLAGCGQSPIYAFSTQFFDKLLFWEGGGLQLQVSQEVGPGRQVCEGRHI